MKINKKVIILLLPTFISIIVGVALLANFYVSSSNLFFTPDEASFSFFSDKIIENGLPYVNISLNQEYGTTAFSPYYMANINGVNLLPDHFTFVLFLSTLKLLIPEEIVNLLLFIISTFIFTLLLYKINKKLYVALFGGVSFSISYIFLHYTRLLFSDIFLLYYFVIIGFCFVILNKRMDSAYVLILFFSIFNIIGIRYSNIFLLFPVFAMSIYILSKFKNKLKLILFIALIGLIVLSPILYLNYFASGKVFIIPSYENSLGTLEGKYYPNYSVQQQNLSYLDPSYSKPVSFNLMNIPPNFILYFGIYPYILILFAFLIFSIIGHKENHFWIYFILFTSIWYTLVILSSENFFSVGSLSVHNSLARYMIPMYGIYLFGASLGLGFFVKSNSKVYSVFIIFLLCTVFILSQFIQLETMNLGLSSIKTKIPAYSDVQSVVFNNTSPNDVIITSVWEKLIYPERNVLVYARIPFNILISEVNRISYLLNREGRGVYIIFSPTESKYYSITSSREVTFDNLSDNLSDNFNLTLIEKRGEIELYKLS